MSRDATLPTGIPAAAVAPSYVARHAVKIVLQPAYSNLLFCEGPGSLTINSEVYSEAAFSLDEVKVGEWPTITVRVPNNANQISEPDAMSDVVRGAAITVYEVLWDPATGNQLGPATLFLGEIASVDYKADQATLRCTTRSTGTGAAGQVGRVIGRLCHYVFGSPAARALGLGARCGYAGANTSCDHTMAGCTANGNLSRFGGWPSIPAIGTKFSYSVPNLIAKSDRAGTVAPTAPISTAPTITPTITAPGTPRLRKHLGRP